MKSQFFVELRDNVEIVYSMIYSIFSNVSEEGEVLKYIYTKDGVLSAIVLLLGILYCLFGSKLKKFSATTLLAVVVYTAISEYPQVFDTITDPVHSFITSLIFSKGEAKNGFIPEIFIDEDIMYGKILVSLLLTFVLVILAPVGEWAMLFGFFFYTQKALKDCWKDEKYSFEYIHIAAAMLLTLLSYLIFRKVESLVLIFATSFFGSTIILLGTSVVLNMPSNFTESLFKLLELDIGKISIVPFLYFFLLFAFTMIFQYTFFRNKN